MSGYRTQSMDTDRRIEANLLDALRSMTPSEKMRRWDVSCHEARELAIAGIRHRHPDADEHELRMRYAARYLTPELLLRAFGWDASAAGP